MKNKSIKVARRFVNIIMALLIVVCFCAIGLSVFNLVNYNVEASKYIYLLLGVFLLPCEYFFKGKLDGFFQQQSNIFICLLISVCLLILIITLVSFISKMFNNKYSSVKRTLWGIFANIILLLFLLVFVLSVVFFTAKYSQIINAVNNFGPDFIKTITTNFGFNALVIKELIVAYLGAVVCVFGLVSFIIGMSHKSTKIKILSSINFYSSEYEEVKSEGKTKDEKQELDVVTEMPETNPNAKNLINKIMQLEELKNAGKIDNVDYTRLRQKAIRRYKSR